MFSIGILSRFLGVKEDPSQNYLINRVRVGGGSDGESLQIIRVDTKKQIVTDRQPNRQTDRLTDGRPTNAPMEGSTHD